MSSTPRTCRKVSTRSSCIAELMAIKGRSLVQLIKAPPMRGPTSRGREPPDDESDPERRHRRAGWRQPVVRRLPPLGLYCIGLLSAVVRWRMILRVMGHRRAHRRRAAGVSRRDLREQRHARHAPGRRGVPGGGHRHPEPGPSWRRRPSSPPSTTACSEVLPVARGSSCAPSPRWSRQANAWTVTSPSILMIVLVAARRRRGLLATRPQQSLVEESPRQNRRKSAGSALHGGRGRLSPPIVWVQDVMRLIVAAAALGVKGDGVAGRRTSAVPRALESGALPRPSVASALRKVGVGRRAHVLWGPGRMRRRQSRQSSAPSRK